MRLSVIQNNEEEIEKILGHNSMSALTEPLFKNCDGHLEAYSLSLKRAALKTPGPEHIELSSLSFKEKARNNKTKVNPLPPNVDIVKKPSH